VEAALGRGFHLRGISAEVVPNGVWPLDFGGPFGEPVTRGIEAKLPWWNGADNPAGKAVRAAGLQGGEAIDPKEVFTRKQQCRHALGREILIRCWLAGMIGLIFAE
jgi:hypothetical protein